MNWPYIAGFVDGEGCFRLHKGKSRHGNKTRFYPLVTVGNSDWKIMKKLHQKLGGSLSTWTFKNPKHKPSHRLCVELCENVHLHYRNLRLEFSSMEFVLFLQALRGIDPRVVYNFPYSKDAFQEIASAKLPPHTEHNDRAQWEEQADGTHHFHYRNLRIEAKKPEDIGL